MSCLLSSPLETQRLTIRPIEAHDLDALFVHHSDPVVTRYIPHVRWATRADADPWFARVLERREKQSAVQCVVVRRAADAQPEAVIGTLMLFNFERASGLAELGYLLGRVYTGRGFATEAATAFLDFAFAGRESGGLGLRRIEATIDARNEASNRLAERLGFVREGLLRERWLADGELQDINLFGLLSRDWRHPVP
jgi:RimJ/RimL family protein N-acetyltransferase